MSSIGNSNRDKERLVHHHPSSADDDPPSSIINHNDNYSTFTPKTSDDDKTRNTNSKDDEVEETTCCCCCSDKPCCCNKKCCSDLWKEHRFTIMLALALLVSLAVPLYFLIRHAHFEFDYHKECVICFKDKADFEVIFNQTSGECEFYQQQELYDSNDIVLDPNFCGAPHCQNLELLPGLRLVPYWSVAVSAVLSVVLSVGVNLIKYNCYLPIKKRFVKWKWDEELVEENPIIRLADEYEVVIREAVERDACGVDAGKIRSDLKDVSHLSTFLKTFGLTDPYLFVLLFLFALGHFGFCVYEVVTKPAFVHLDGWHKYQTIYGLFLNSGSIEVLWFGLSMGPLSLIMQGLTFDQEGWKNTLEKFLQKNTSLVPQQIFEEALNEGQNLRKTLMMPLLQFKVQHDSVEIFLVGSAVLVTAPVFLTHIFPGIVLFIPFWGCILLALGFVGTLGIHLSTLGKNPTRHENFHHSSMFLPSFAVVRLVGSFCVVLLFPMIFNWTVLFYEGRTWSDVMTEEYRLRNTDCYFNTLVNNIQIYNVGFMGLIFS